MRSLFITVILYNCLLCWISWDTELDICSSNDSVFILHVIILFHLISVLSRSFLGPPWRLFDEKIQLHPLFFKRVISTSFHCENILSLKKHSLEFDIKPLIQRVFHEGFDSHLLYSSMSFKLHLLTSTFWNVF